MPRKGSGKEKKNKQTKKALKKDSPGKERQGGIKNSDHRRQWIEKAGLIVMLAVVSGLLFIGPFERGLFFPRELLAAKAVIFGLLIVWGYFRLASRDGRLIESPLDICLVVLLLAYLVSFFVAVHKRDALEELLKIASYLVVYLAAIEISRYWYLPLKKLPGNPDHKPTQANTVKEEDRSGLPPGLNLLLHFCLGAAFVVTIASLGAAAGYWEFAGTYASARIASPMGYANTAAAYLMAAYLLALGLAPLAANKWHKIIYLIPASLMLVTVILTFSRGAWLLLPPLAILLIVVASPGERLRSFLYLAVTAAAAVPAAFLADPSFRAGEPGRAWIIIVIALAGTVLLGLGAEFYLSRSRQVRLALAGAAAAVFVIAFVALIVLPATGPIHLERGAEQEAEMQRVEQVVGDVVPGGEYRLALEINADEETTSDHDSTGYAWGVRVLEGVEGYKDVEVFDHRGGGTDGWETREFTFNTGDEPLRLVVQIYNRYPGTSVAARDVTLTGADREQNLSFAFNRVLPDRFYDRLFSYSLDRNLERRLDFYVDAAKIIRDYPLLGTGGGGWNALYRSYQGFPYSSTEVHNHFLQVWIEAGLFGFLAFTGIWVSFAAAFIRNCVRQNVSQKVWQHWTASFIPVAALGAHSVIDWNFSMAAVGIFLFVLLGAGRSLDRGGWFGRQPKDNRQVERRGFYIGLGGIIAGVVLLAFTISLIHGLYATWRSQEHMERGNYKQAMTEMESALRTDPYRTDNYHNLNVLIEDRVRRTQSPEEIEEMLVLAESAYELEPFNPRYVSRYGSLLLQYVDVEKGLKYLDSLIELRPFVEGSYRQPAISRLQVAEFLMQEGEYAQAERYLKEIFEIEPLIKEYYGEIEPLAFALGRAHYLLGDYDSAIYYYKKVAEEDGYYDTAQSDLEAIRDEW